jgi:hypothetical protein
MGTTKQVSDVADSISIHERSGPRIRFGCGHEGESEFMFMVYGQHAKMSERTMETRSHCADCHVAILRLQVIRCCTCGFPIFPGSQVAFGDVGSSRGRWKETLFQTTTGDGRTLTHAVSCAGTDCIEGAAVNGIWTGYIYKMSWGDQEYTPINR